MNPRRRRFARMRRSVRRQVEQWVQAHHDHDYTAMARLEKLATLQAFARMLTERGVTTLPAILRRRVISASVRGYTGIRV
jgi:hypothetical protein